MTKYRVTTLILGILLIGSLLFVISALLEGTLTANVTTAAPLVLAAILAAHIRGWRWSAEATVIGVTALVIGSMEPTYLSQNLQVSLLVPPIIAAALLSPAWSLGIFGGALLATVLQSALTTG